MEVMNYRTGCVFLFLLLMLGVAPPAARAQEVMIELSPKSVTTLACADLMANVDVQDGDFATAAKLAAASGYRQGYVVGYLHGRLDAAAHKTPLTREELETFAGNYELVCKDDPQLSIYEAARRAMAFQSR
jgi:hypothetical protein